MGDVRSNVQGVDLPEASTKEAEEMQARQPNAVKVVEPQKLVTFVGSGINFLQTKVTKTVIEDGKAVDKIITGRVEVAFTKANNYRFTTSDRAVVSILKKQGFKIVPKEQLKKESDQRFKDSRSQRASNASMQDYVDARIAELSSGNVCDCATDVLERTVRGIEVQIAELIKDIAGLRGIEVQIAELIKDIAGLKTKIALKAPIAGPIRTRRPSTSPVKRPPSVPAKKD